MIIMKYYFVIYCQFLVKFNSKYLFVIKNGLYDLAKLK